jgi:hypothetical protein
MAVSKGLPPDFGVFAEPKEANAPEPRPKALVGEATPPGVVLKGFDLACDGVLAPERLAYEDGSVAEEPLCPLLGVVNDSLLVLIQTKLVSACANSQNKYTVHGIYSLSAASP